MIIGNAMGTAKPIPTKILLKLHLKNDVSALERHREGINFEASKMTAVGPGDTFDPVLGCKYKNYLN